jgi:hypothetical protein
LQRDMITIEVSRVCGVITPMVACAAKTSAVGRKTREEERHREVGSKGSEGSVDYVPYQKILEKEKRWTSYGI